MSGVDIADSCRKAALLISARQDRELTAVEQVALAAHLKICDYCTLFEKQSVFIRRGIDAWKNYLG